MCFAAVQMERFVGEAVMRPLNIVITFNGTMKIKLYEPYYVVLYAQNTQTQLQWTMVIS